MRFLQAAGGDASRAAGISAWLKSRDPKLLAQACEKGSITFTLDGKPVGLQLGSHFTIQQQ